MGILESRFVQDRLSCCGSRLNPLGHNSLRVSTAEASAVLELCSVSNAPRMDTFSESDVYVIAFLARANGERVGTLATFPYKMNHHSPVWDQRHILSNEVIKSEADFLTVQLYDHDDGLTTYFWGEDRIGAAKIPVSDLQAKTRVELVTYPVELTKLAAEAAASDSPNGAPSCQVSIRVWPREIVRRWPTRKVIFIVRHGQSKWNQAEKEVDVKGMLETVDHSLSVDGLSQASALAERVKVKHSQASAGIPQMNLTPRSPRTPRIGDQEDAPQNVYDAFYSAEAFLASPLTRAVQTALIALRHHPKLHHVGLKLRAELREIKNLGGMDTIGSARGGAIRTHVHQELQSLYQEADAADACKTLARLTSVPINTNNTEDEWWSDIKEDEQDAQERVSELLVQLKLCSESSIVVVGHSDFFRFLCSHFLSSTCRKLYPETSHAFGLYRMMNCGVAALCVDFSLPIEACITDIFPMFETPLPS
eukprot:TRINITY_DN39722_c0_g1_i1.p1 TRINITY_DN39722_c0_g1~~TRINITY_DN39722_c0_g1_i1.p1  ORF type:complete len:479 (-),score=62.91 TRINITY_DN39722_c0_g1_i1:422-1858(-)